ncbi:MAG: hypothetical protein JWP63_112 [Candidatus Solibacter sp.]|nr:hypothetical protein [Candidatus Solibacter sp.]
MRLVLLALFCLPAMAAAPAVWTSAHELRFVLDDPLHHPFLAWPRTLLSYPVRFEEKVALDHLVLTRKDTGERVPVQFSNVTRDSATLNFFSDLPGGAHREFVLTLAAPQAAQPGVSVISEKNIIVLDSGVLKVRIPASQPVTGNAPGPLMQFSRGGKWIGSSTLSITGDPVVSIESAELDSGPLFVTYRLTYTTRSGAKYIATIRCAAGMDFVRFEEDMEGLGERSGVFENTWDGFAVTNRQSSNHPYPFPDRIAKPHTYDDYPWERVDERQMNTHLGVQSGLSADGEMPFYLGLFQPWPAFRVSTFANFWSQSSGDALGVFIDRVTEWQDHDYAVWHSSPALQLRYYYRDGKLSWRWPLIRGRRSTGVGFYDHARDIDAMTRMESAVAGVRGEDGYTYHGHLSPTSHAMWMQSRYGTLDLNMVKDWTLAYPDSARHPKALFTQGQQKRAADLERMVISSGLTNELALSGTRQNGGFGPVPSRQILDSWIDAYNRLYPEMTDAQRKRITAVFLLMSYTHAAEDYMPMVPMFSGHPNFLSDVKSVPAAMAFLFPDHPQANTWADEWEKFVELNTRYHTRPDVAVWDAQGGRWTENLGTYVWGFIRPAARAGFALQNRDGYQRFVSPQLAQVGEWLVNALSAPFAGESKEALSLENLERDAHEWGVVTPEKGPRRVFPPVGAHAERRMTPRSMWYLGVSLERYAPLTAEHLMWAARPTDQDQEVLPGRIDPWDAMYARPDNRGTNPHLRSAKYTGSGIILRAAVDTPDELSIHLGQIDEGPNYRWGVAAEGGGGGLYFFAKGKAYNHNGGEDVGDRFAQDTDFGTNFGVWKNGAFRSIGQNVLSRPMYDLNVAQFAELVPRSGAGTYATPEYVSRSVLLAGHDYFVLYDDVANQAVGHRLSWFVRRGDEFPSIELVKGAERRLETNVTDLATRTTLGKWFDGLGDSMAVISARKDLKSTPTPYGCTVQGPGVDDLIFRDHAGVKYESGGVAFEGTAGVVRHRGQGYEFALFHGTKIAIPGLSLSLSNTDIGIAGTSTSGSYYAPTPGTLQVNLPAGTRFYIDGAPQSSLTLITGLHRWEITAGVPVPIAPAIDRTENLPGGARVIAQTVASATSYAFSISRDNGLTWTSAGVAARPEIELRGLPDGAKVHVRVTASNTEHAGAPGPEYPIYVTSKPPAPPDGLRVQLADGAAMLTWGDLLGVAEYRLYVHTASSWQLIYHGRDRTYLDRRAGIRKSDAIPGGSHEGPIVQYQVTAVNGNGEGPPSRIADSDPSSWRNWDPMPGESFRRSSLAIRTEVGQESLPRYYPR